jgi:outer membrane protein assembly factor BamB
MGKKIVAVVASLLLLSAIGVLTIHLKNQKQYNTLHFYKSIPTNVSSVVVFNNWFKTLSAINHADSLFKSLQWIKPIQKLNHFRAQLNVQKWISPNAIEQMSAQPFAICIFDEPDSTSYLFCIPFATIKSEKTFVSQLKNGQPVITQARRRESIYVVRQEQSQAPFYISAQNGVLLISAHENLIIKAIHQLNSPQNIMDETSFLLAQKTASPEAHVNVFFNTSADNPIFQHFTNHHSPLYNSKIWGKWLAIDIDISTNGINISGVASSHPEQLPAISQLFKSSLSPTFKLLGQLPESTVFATICHFGNDTAQTKQNRSQYQKILQKKQPEKMPDYAIKGEVAIIHALFPNDEASNRYLVLETSGPTEAFLQLNKFLDNQESGFSAQTVYSPDSYTQIPIYNGFGNGKLQLQFNDVFSNVPEKYFSIFKNQIVFADSITALKNYLYQKVLDRTLINQPLFNEFQKQLPSNGNIQIYAAPSYFPFLFGQFEREEQHMLKNFYACGLQTSAHTSIPMFSFHLMHAPHRDIDPITNWQSKLDTLMTMKPVIVVNPQNHDKQFLVQDLSGKIYLISSSGVIIWQKMIDDIINGEIQLVDFFKNGKTQFAFAAGDKIHLIDHHGNNVNQFPILLPAKASNPLAVFDYENTNDLRFVIACENNSVLVFNKQGNRLPDWSFKTTETTVTFPIQHIQAQGKDFIVIADKNRYYFLDRRGNERAAFLPSSMPKPIAPLVQTSRSSQKCTMVTISENGEIVWFTFPDITITKTATDLSIHKNPIVKPIDTKSKKYLYSDNLQLALIDDSGKIIWQKPFEEGIVWYPDIYNFGSQGKKMGLTTFSQQLYMYNEDGSMYNGFPLIGVSRFSIGTMPNSESSFHLIVGGKNHFLYNYHISTTAAK